MDKFTLEIIQDALVAIGDEMFIAMQKSSMSPIIYESLDYAVGLTDENGLLLAQGNGVTMFLACLDEVVKSTIAKHPIEQMKEGDIFIANTPYEGGGTHLSDVSVIIPVFYKNTIVAFTVNKAHWTELGGTYPGSVSTNATEVYQEGLHFPFVKIQNQGILNTDIIEIIKANVRLPDSTIGDLMAGIAAANVGTMRIIDVIEKYGLDTFNVAKEELLNYGEKMTIEALQAFPDLNLSGESVLEDDGFGNGPYPIKATVKTENGRFIVDFTGTHAQLNGPLNLSYKGLVSGVRSLFKAITTPNLPANGGAFRVLDVLCESGTLVSAEAPAACSVYYEVMVTSIDLVWRMLSEAMPNLLPAGHFRSICATFISGIHHNTKEFYIQAEPLAGGWGATFDHDGNRGQLSCGSGESYNIPIEIREMRYGLMVDQFVFHNEGGGYGEFQGGNGQYVDYRILSDQAHLTAAFLGAQVKTWGAHGGHDGSYNYVRIIKKNGEESRHSLITNALLEKGDVVRCVTATGGGYGKPENRNKEQVLLDVKNGYITKKEARTYYNINLN